MIVLGAGSTTLHLARLLLSQKDLIIFTNSIPIVEALTPSENRIFMLDGSLRNPSLVRGPRSS
ncbi:hypothetical protein [Enterococcus florum]|uniref:hypothetical protein n=1 Tax=Enterococcus florum TaxID=2480627 RepID=UPI0011BAB93A